jgi:toxin FitB
MPNGKRKKALEADVDAILKQEFAGRVLPFDSKAAIEYAAIVSARRALGKPISQFDAQIAAIARANGAEAIVTRNVADFASVNVQIIDPWSAV